MSQFYTFANGWRNTSQHVETVQMGTSRSQILDLAPYVVAGRSDDLPPLRLEPATAVRWLIPIEKAMEGIGEMIALTHDRRSRPWRRSRAA
jgi:hypothetical protein